MKCNISEYKPHVLLCVIEDEKKIRKKKQIPSIQMTEMDNLSTIISRPMSR